MFRILREINDDMIKLNLFRLNIIYASFNKDIKIQRNK